MVKEISVNQVYTLTWLYVYSWFIDAQNFANLRIWTQQAYYENCYVSNLLDCKNELEFYAWEGIQKWLLYLSILSTGVCSIRVFHHINVWALLSELFTYLNTFIIVWLNWESTILLSQKKVQTSTQYYLYCMINKYLCMIMNNLCTTKYWIVLLPFHHLHAL